MNNNDVRSLLESAADPAQTALARRAARPTLDACWPPLRGAIEPKIVDVLLEALGPLTRSGQEDEVRAARVGLANDQAFARAFSIALQGAFNTALQDFIDGKPAPASVQVAGVNDVPADPSEASKRSSPKTWSLVEFDDMEISIAVETGSNRIRYVVDDIYSSVKLRLANLTQTTDLRDGENPFRPAMVLRAVYAALKAVEVKDEQLLPVLRRFESGVAGLMARAYAALDQHLDAQGIRNQANLSGVARPHDPFAPEQRVGGLPTSADADAMLRALYQHLSVGALPAAASAALGPTPLARPGTTAPASKADLSGVGVIEPVLLAALNELQKLGTQVLEALQKGEPATSSATHERAPAHQRLAEKASHQVDKLTIEIVGLLFDRVSRDAYVPQPVKALLEPLQAPLTKVALMDSELFVSTDHAARQLIDRVASTAIGWVDEGEENARYLAEVGRAVHTVLDAVDGAIVQAFDKAHQGFETYLAQERSRTDDPIMRAQRALAEAEAQEIMVINATMQIRRAFDAVQIEAYLRDFLLQTWPRVLVAVSLREKNSEAKHAGVRTYLSIVPDLVWSVQPKLNVEERKQLVGTIPAVLSIVRKGLMLIDWSKDKIQHFFAQLMQSHAQAVKALEWAQTVSTPTFEASTLRIKLDGLDLSSTELDPATAPEALQVDDTLVRRALQDNGAEVMHICAAAAVKEEQAAVEEGSTQASIPGERAALSVGYIEIDAAQLLTSMKRGQWFALEHEGERQQVQLRWVSPHKTFYLLTSAQGTTAHSLSPQVMSELLSSGRMRPLEAEPLFERAVRDVLQDLRDASAQAKEANLDSDTATNAESH